MLKKNVYKIKDIMLIGTSIKKYFKKAYAQFVYLWKSLFFLLWFPILIGNLE